MKKIVIGAAILLQSAFGMENLAEVARANFCASITALVRSSFLSDEIGRFRSNIATAIENVTTGAFTVDQAISNVVLECRTWFDLFRGQVNVGYFEQSREQREQQNANVQGVIIAKNREIQLLQERLDTLLQASRELSVNLRSFDQERIEAEADVRRARESAEVGVTCELITEAQINRTAIHFSADLEKIKAEILAGRRTVEGAFARTEEKYSDSIEALIASLEDRYADISADSARQTSEKITRITEAYDRQITLMQRILNTLVAANERTTKEKELVSKVSVICLNSHIEPMKIRDRIVDIERMNVFEKHRAVGELYNKFLPFSELFGRLDLGITATQEDLSNICTFLENGKVQLNLPVRETNVSVHNVNWWGEPTILEGDYNRMISLHQTFFGFLPGEHEGNWAEYGIVHMSGGRRNRNGWWKLGPIFEAGNKVNAELEKRYKTAKAAYDAEVERASRIAFPRESLNRLVEQFNGFICKI